jgi:hypothetical protein
LQALSGALPPGRKYHSEIHPGKIPIRETFDLIWVGSLLTHLDEPLWHEFLAFHVDRLNPQGLLVLTAHGRDHDDRTAAPQATAPQVAAVLLK